MSVYERESVSLVSSYVGETEILSLLIVYSYVREYKRTKVFLGVIRWTLRHDSFVVFKREFIELLNPSQSVGYNFTVAES